MAVTEIASSSPLCHPFTYFVRGRKGRKLQWHQLRDLAAVLFLSPVLQRRGYQIAAPILNYPAPPRAAPYPVDASMLRACDLLFLPTRPPLHDMEDGVRLRVDRSYTTLEAKIFACLLRYLPHCSRAKVTVADALARAFPEVARLWNVQFRQHGGAAIDAFMPYGSIAFERPAAGSRSTLAFVVFEQHAWPGGPGLLASFGMSGTDTFAWNCLLANRFPHLVASVPFVMAELIAPKAQPQTLTATFGLDWEVRILTPTAAAKATTGDAARSARARTVRGDSRFAASGSEIYGQLLSRS